MSDQLLNGNDLNTQNLSDTSTSLFQEITPGTSGTDEVTSGTAGNDNLTGSILSGLEGNDTLVGNGSANTLFGNGGDDLLRGGTGANTLIGDTGNDIIYAGGTSNAIIGGDGNDIDTIMLHEGKSSIKLMEGTNHDIINNFKLGSTTLFVENMDELSFKDAPEGTHIMQGEDLIAVSVGVSSQVFTQNKDAIFEPFGGSGTLTDGSSVNTDGTGTVTFHNPDGTTIIF